MNDRLLCTVCKSECSKWDSYCGTCGANRVQASGRCQTKIRSEAVVIFLSEERKAQDDAFEIVLESKFKNRLFAKPSSLKKWPIWVLSSSLEQYFQKSFYIGDDSQPRIKIAATNGASALKFHSFKTGLGRAKTSVSSCDFYLPQVSRARREHGDIENWSCISSSI